MQFVYLPSDHTAGTTPKARNPDARWPTTTWPWAGS